MKHTGFVGAFLKIISIFVLLCFCFVGCSDQSELSFAPEPKQSVAEYAEKAETTPAELSKNASEHSESSDAFPTVLSADNAVVLIFELPEIKAWSNYIEHKSQGKVHGAIMATSKGPQDIDGKQYWSIDFYESQETHMHRWESFWVRVDGKEILIDDLADGPISIQDWRDQKKPLERIKS